MSRIALAGLIALGAMLGTAAPAVAAPPAPLTRTVTANFVWGLRGVSCLSSKDCFGVGYKYVNGTQYVPVYDMWNGKTWKHYNIPTPSGMASISLSHVSCLSATFCMAVGSAIKGSTGVAFADRWNGKTWAPAVPPAPVGSGTLLTGVSCVSVKSCVAVGSYTGGVGALGESWNGTRWNRTRPIVPAGAGGPTMASVSCVRGTSYCFAAGSYDSNGDVSPLIESWNGRNWKRMQAAPFPAGSVHGGLTGISCSSVKSCAAVGSYTVYYMFDIEEMWNGRIWTVITNSSWTGVVVGETSLTGVSCVAASFCAAAGPVTDGDFNPDGGVAIWNGGAWDGTGIALDGWLNDASCVSVKFCVAVGVYGGNHGVSVFWNGQSWKVVDAS